MKGFKKIRFFILSIFYIFQTIILRKKIPLIGGLVINDRCNLQCSYCSVSNRNIPDMTFEEIRKALNILYNSGTRNLYIEGGEPFLWTDENYTLDDIIILANQIGFSYVIVYTNGTFPIESKADTVFVSIDGIRDFHDQQRGKSYDKIIENIKRSDHNKIIVNCTLTAKNKDHISDFCTEISKIDKIKGLFFYIYTPTEYSESLIMKKQEKEDLIHKIMELKRKGFRILNSRSGLKSALHDKWERPNHLSIIYADHKLYTCCRFFGMKEICEQCGYLSFTEIYNLSRLNINAVLTALKYV